MFGPCSFKAAMSSVSKTRLPISLFDSYADFNRVSIVFLMQTLFLEVSVFSNVFVAISNIC